MRPVLFALRIPLACIALLAASVHPATVEAKQPPVDHAGTFDYYTLALSWSPTFCDSDAGRREREQCQSRRRFAFVVHGLWPQYERGWPQNCRTDDRWLDKKTIEQMTDIMPSKKLVIHEWNKHGSCSGLGQKGYFDATRELFRRIKIPARYQQPDSYVTTTPQQLEQDFIAANPGLTPDMIHVACGSQRRLREVRICFTKDLKLRACGVNEGRDCGSPTLVLPPVR